MKGSSFQEKIKNKIINITQTDKNNRNNSININMCIIYETPLS